MDHIFDMEGPIITFLSRITDFMLLNILFILCCIPVVTIGASITALHYVIMKSVINQEDPAILKGFFKAFKENFKQATIVWLVVIAIAAVAIADIAILKAGGARFGGWFVALIVIIAIAVFVVVMYTYALMARFENSLGQTVRNATLMSLRHIMNSFAMMIVYLSPFALIVWQAWGAMAVLLVGFSCSAYINCFKWKEIFENYIDSSQDDNEYRDGGT